MQTQTRRDFGKKVLLVGGTAVAVAPFLGFPSCETIEADIMNYVPVALTSFNQILTLINPAEAAVLAPVTAAVKAALADIQAAVTIYENAPVGDKTTLAGKIATAISAAEQELQQFWSDLKLPDSGLVATIEGVIQIILSTMAAFIPSLGGNASAVKARPLAKTITFTEHKRSVKQFKKDINAAFVAGHQAPIFK